jgi:hypothetical protein
LGVCTNGYDKLPGTAGGKPVLSHLLIKEEIEFKVPLKKAL